MAGSSPGSSLDYSFWTGEDFKRLPPHIALYHDPMREISWLWRHGFRVRDTRMSPVKPLWMCAPCSYRREAKMEKYIIVANYTQVIEVHLLRKHGIKKKYGGKPLACSSAPEEPSVRTTRNSVKAQVSKSPKPDEDQHNPESVGREEEPYIAPRLDNAPQSPLQCCSKQAIQPTTIVQ
ncbi:hypothetical protein GGR50DRAFT_481548 [Xylaria sp. CBS 124048]|nr:hypothetical protein GGR50DRAFT_481548 [Xylaria sp. CBS 124048]